MRGRIHGIWLTQANGSLHPNIVPNFGSLVTDAIACDFSVNLWTNISEISPEEVERLKEKNITVRDHGECQSSAFYPYFKFFLDKGISGDKTAFALASDILRMAILELASPEEFFIYIDPNDVVFVSLKEDLSTLPKAFAINAWGFSFYVAPMFGRQDHYQLRNDVLIARKSQNPEFIEYFLQTYQRHLKETHQQYVTPISRDHAVELPLKISNPITPEFFNVWDPIRMVVTTFNKRVGEFMQLARFVNSESFLSYHREIRHGNSWLPSEGLAQEVERMEKLAGYTGKEVSYACSHVDKLNEVFAESNVSFGAFMHPECYVDAALERKDWKRDTTIFAHLTNHGIHAYCTFFKGKNYLVVDKVNVEAVGDKIHSLPTLSLDM